MQNTHPVSRVVASLFFGLRLYCLVAFCLIAVHLHLILIIFGIFSLVKEGPKLQHEPIFLFACNIFSVVTIFGWGFICISPFLSNRARTISRKKVVSFFVTFCTIVAQSAFYWQINVLNSIRETTETREKYYQEYFLSYVFLNIALSIQAIATFVFLFFAICVCICLFAFRRRQIGEPDFESVDAN
jgi:hypothetical protein